MTSGSPLEQRHDDSDLPTVTVVIPTKNREQLLRRTLASVLAQEGVQLEVLVVDDGGRADLGALVTALRDHRVRVLRHEVSLGVSAARNTGLRQVTSDWVAFCDDDDLWSPLKLRSQIEVLLAHEGSLWACSGAVNLDSHYRVHSWSPPPASGDVADDILALNIVPGGGSAVLVATETARGLGGFDEHLSNIADWDFYIRLALRSPVATVDRPHIAYYIHDRGISHNHRLSQAEYGYLDIKYESERRRRGVELNRQEWRSYMAVVAFRARQPLRGTLIDLGLVLRNRHWRSAARAAAGIAPRALSSAIRVHRWERSAPPLWKAEFATWSGLAIKAAT